MSELSTIIMKNKGMSQQYHSQFKQLTGLNLDNYMDCLMGFDITRFMDEQFPDFMASDKSAEETITDKWGIEVTNMIKEML